MNPAGESSGMTPRSSPRSIDVRELRSEDQPQWRVLWNGYLDFYRCELPQAVTEFTWRRLIDQGHGLHGFAAVDATDGVVGIVHFQFQPSTWSLTSYCYLEDLFVAPKRRGSGAGSALIRAVYRAADERGAGKVYWTTENSNERARSLYDRMATLTPFLQYRR